MTNDLKHMRVLAGIEESRQSWSLPNINPVVAEADDAEDNDKEAAKDDDKKSMKPWLAKKGASVAKDDDEKDADEKDADAKDAGEKDEGIVAGVGKALGKVVAAPFKAVDSLGDKDKEEAQEEDTQEESLGVDIDNYKRLIGDAGEGYRDWSLPVIK